MSAHARLLHLLRHFTTTCALLALALATLLAIGCATERRGGDDDDDDDSSASDDDDTGSDDDDDTGSGDDDDTGSGDDDTGSGDDDTSSGGDTAPTVQMVVVCEQANPQAPPGGSLPACEGDDFFAQFNIQALDPDGDLQDPTVGLSVGGQPPVPQQLSGDLGDGATKGIALIICSTWPRGGSIPYAVTVTDANGNESLPYQDTWAVPSATGVDDCP